MLETEKAVIVEKVIVGPRGPHLHKLSQFACLLIVIKCGSWRALAPLLNLLM